MQKKSFSSSIGVPTETSVEGLGVENALSQQLRPLSSSALAQASSQFDERLRVLTLMEQVNHLCRGVQRHRGFSMGLLAGNKSFLRDFDLLQQQMNRRIQLIAAFANLNKSLLTHMDIERLHYAWNTIRDNWQEDSVLENFEFHSHFVDQLLVIMSRLTEKVRQPYSLEIRQLVSNVKQNETNRDKLYPDLLYFSHRKLPRFIEFLGKVRALSVHSAAVGFCDKEHQRKLYYLLNCIEQEREVLFELTAALQMNLIDRLPSLLTIKTYEYKLDFLLEKISQEILAVSVVAIKEEEVFSLVTDIIDIYWRVVDDSLSLLNIWQNEDLEQWLLEG
ncbi:MAG: hypothetical protein ACRBBR_05735 [Cellvibrionaceae bacterium]